MLATTASWPVITATATITRAKQFGLWMVMLGLEWCTGSGYLWCNSFVLMTIMEQSETSVVLPALCCNQSCFHVSLVVVYHTLFCSPPSYQYFFSLVYIAIYVLFSITLYMHGLSCDSLPVFKDAIPVDLMKSEEAMSSKQTNCTLTDRFPVLCTNVCADMWCTCATALMCARSCAQWAGLKRWRASLLDTGLIHNQAANAAISGRCGGEKLGCLSRPAAD